MRSEPSELVSGLLDMLDALIAEANGREALAPSDEREGNAASGVAMAVVKGAATAVGEGATNDAAANCT